MTFKEAVEETPGLENAYEPGLQALIKVDRKRLSCAGPTGSVDIDKTLVKKYPTIARWDYGVGRRKSNSEEAIWIEVHDANSTHVAPMIEKLRWLKTWLATEANALGAIDSGEYHWIATSAISLRQGSRQAIQLSQAGLRFPTEYLKI